MKKLWKIVLVLAIFAVNFNMAWAAAGINRKINFQGKVVNKGVGSTDGTNVADGNHNMVFSLWSTLSAGTSIWSETWNAGTTQVSVTSGIFQVALGTMVTFPPTVDFNSDSLYLSVNYEGDGDMVPRVQMAAVPYAFNAEKVGGLTVTNTTGTLTVPSGALISFGSSFVTSGVGISLNQNLNTGSSVTFAGLSVGGTVSFTGIPVGVGTTVLYLSATGLLTQGTLPSYSAVNGLKLNGLAIGLGGTLTGNTNIGTSSFSLSFQGVGGVQTLFIGASGYVGIGATNPNQKFIIGDDASQSTFRINGGNNVDQTAVIAMNRTGINEWVIAETQNGDINFGTIQSGGNYPDYQNSTIGKYAYMVMNNFGAVGIGTTNPTYKLHVASSIGSTSVTTTNFLSIGTSANVGTNLNVGGSVTFSGLPVGVGTTVIYVGANGVLVQGTFPAGGTTYTASTGITLVGNDFRLSLGTTNIWLGAQIFNGGIGVTGNLAVGGSVTFSGLPVGVGTSVLYVNSSGLLVQGTLPPGGAGPWSTGSGLTYLTDTTSDLILGASTAANATFFMDVSTGGLYLGKNEAINGGLTFYSSGVGVSDPTIGTDASGNLNIAAPSGQVVVGNGAGDINFSITGETNVLSAGKTATLTGTYASADFSFKRMLTGGANNQGGDVFYITDVSTGTGSTMNPDMLVVNSALGSGTFVGNLLRLQVNGVDKLLVNASGNVGIGTSAPANKLSVFATGVPANDLVNISNIGYGVTNAGVGALQIDYYGGAANVEASAMRVNMTTGGTSGGIWNLIRLVGTSAATGVTENAIKIDDKTNGPGTSIGLNIGTSWDYGIYSRTTGINYFAGKVGIGTSTPGVYALNIAGTLAGNDGYFSGNIGIGASISGLFYINVGGTGYFNDLSAGTMSIGTTIFQNAYVLNIAGTIGGNDAYFSGNIGIGASISGIYNLNIGGSGYSANFSSPKMSIGTTNFQAKYVLNIAGTMSGNDQTLSGNLSIGASVSGYMLQVQGSQVSGVAFFNNTYSTSGTAPVIVIQTGIATTAVSGGGFINFNNSSGVKVGRIRLGTGASGVAYATTAAADFAEYVVASEPTDAGDLIAFSNNKFIKATAGQPLAGIHSANPSFVGNDEQSGQVNAFPLAMSGIVKLKVSSINGPISPGDPLTASSISGVAAKAISAGGIAARAIESYTNSDPNQVGMISVIANLSWYDPGVSITKPIGFDLVQLKYQTNLDGLTVAVDELKTSKISPLIDSNGNPVKLVINNDVQITGSLNVGLLTADRISAGSIDGLELLATRIDKLENDVKNLTGQVAGLATSSALANVSPAPIPTAIPVENNLFKNATEFWNNVLLKGEVVFEKAPTFNKDTGGFAVINVGQTGIEVDFETAFTEIPIVNVTMTVDDGQEEATNSQNYSYYVTKKSKSSFVIRMNKPAQNKLQFSWSALLIKEAKTFEVQITPTPTPTILVPTATDTPVPTVTLGITTTPEAMPSAGVGTTGP